MIKVFASLHYIDGTCVEMLKTKTIRSNNRSGYTGVFFDKASKKWRAEIMLQCKRKCLGKFKYKRDAIKARKTAVEELHHKFILEHIENGGKTRYDRINKKPRRR